MSNDEVSGVPRGSVDLGTVKIHSLRLTENTTGGERNDELFPPAKRYIMEMEGDYQPVRDLVIDCPDGKKRVFKQIRIKRIVIETELYPVFENGQIILYEEKPT